MFAHHDLLRAHSTRWVAIAVCWATTVCAVGYGQDQVDADEILRRGDMVQSVGTIRSAEVDLFGEALATPPDDSHKWYLSILVQPGCAPCNTLKRDFLQAPELKAWANVADPAKSWAHLNWYRIDDPTQAHRWTQIKIGGVPTLLVQPPRSGEFGKPEHVVLQLTGYDGDPKELSKKIGDGIRRYLSEGLKRGVFQRSGAAPVTAVAGTGDIGAPPPFKLPDQPTQPTWQPEPNVPFVFPPAPQGPQPATLEQLRAAMPNADPTFLLDQLTKKATVEAAQSAWSLETTRRELQKLRDEALAIRPEGATKPGANGPLLPGWLIALLVGLAGLMAAVFLGLVIAWTQKLRFALTALQAAFETLRPGTSPPSKPAARGK